MLSFDEREKEHFMHKPHHGLCKEKWPPKNVNISRCFPKMKWEKGLFLIFWKLTPWNTLNTALPTIRLHSYMKKFIIFPKAFTGVRLTGFWSSKSCCFSYTKAGKGMWRIWIFWNGRCYTARMISVRLILSQILDLIHYETYLLVAILHKEMKLPGSLHRTLQILSVHPF